MNFIQNPNTGKKTRIKSTNMKSLKQKIKRLKSNQSWMHLSEKKRLHYLIKFKKALQKNSKNLQHILSEETGKASWDSALEVAAAISKLESTQLSYKYRCNYPLNHHLEKTIRTVVKPIGLIAIIAPFNFPIHIPNGQILPALLTGNTVIVKSSEYTQKTSQLIETLWKACFKDIDCPIDFVYGNASIGNALVKSKQTDAVFFTGSSRIGTLIEKECIKLRKPCALEMGGNNALIVEDRLPNILNHMTMSAFISSGQRCTCARRILIKKTHASLINDWINEIKKLSIESYPSKKDPFMGPVVIPSVKELLINKSFDNSTTLLKSRDLGIGGLISPRIEKTRRPCDEEIFGPIAFIQMYDNFEDAIKIVNESQYGLSCSVYTRSKTKFKHAIKHIHSGIINWNTPTTGASGLAPFGGTKNSGNFKPGGFSMIDHCVIATAINEQKKAPKLNLPGDHA